MLKYIFYFMTAISIIMFAFLSCGEKDDIVGSDTDSIENLEASPPYLLANGISSAIIVATVFDSAGKPANDLPVYFQTTAGTITEQEYSNDEGYAYAVLTSKASPNDILATITATVLDTNYSLPKGKAGLHKIEMQIQGFESSPNRRIDLSKCSANGNNTASINVSFLGISFSGEFENASLPADGISQSKLRVTIKETTSKKAIDGADVSLAAAHGVIVNNIQTNSQGIAEASITSHSLALTDTVYIEYGNLFADTLYLDYEKPKISLTPDISYLIADGGSKKTFSVSLKSQENTPIVEAQINFSATRGTITPSSMLTNSEGIAEATLTSAAEVDTNVLVIARLNSYADTSQVSFIQPILGLTPQDGDLAADGTSQMIFTASLILPDNTPVVGAEINFSTSAGSISPALGYTNSEGKITATLKSSYEANPDVVVTASFQEMQQTASVRFLAPILTLTPTESKLLANGSSRQTFCATLLSPLNAPIPNAEISFSTTNGTISQPTATTNTEGKAYTDLRSSTVADSNVFVYAGFHTILDTSSVIFVESSTESGLQLSGATELFRDGISSTTITAIVLDENGNPVSDATVFFSANYGQIAETGITNDGGYVDVTYTADVGVDDADEEITATVGSSVATHAIQLFGLTMNISASVDSIPADGNSTSIISIQLKLTETQTAVPGINIAFSSDFGYIGTVAATDEQGVASIELRAASEPGTATITAQYGLFVKTTEVEFYLNSPQSMLLSANPNFIWVKETGNLEQTLITATVLGVQGQPIGHEVGVRFILQNSPGGGAGFVVAGGEPTAETDPIMTQQGQASVGFRAGTVSGTAEIKAELVDQPTTISRQAVVVIRSGPPYIWIDPNNHNHVIPNMTLYVDYPNQEGLSALCEYKITALLGDKYNNPVDEGTAIYFTTTGGVVTTDVQTNSSGFAVTSLFSGEPFPYVCPLDPINNPHNIVNPNDPALYLPIVINDFESSVVPNSCGNAGENDGNAVIYAYTWGRDQNGNDASVFATTQTVFGGRIDTFGVFVDPPVDTLELGENATIKIVVWDLHGNPPASGSSMQASTSAGKLSVEEFFPSRDRYGFGGTRYSTNLLNNLDPFEDEPQMAEVTIELDAPNPNGKRSGTVYIYLKIN